MIISYILLILIGIQMITINSAPSGACSICGIKGGEMKGDDKGVYGMWSRYDGNSGYAPLYGKDYNTYYDKGYSAPENQGGYQNKGQYSKGYHHHHQYPEVNSNGYEGNSDSGGYDKGYPQGNDKGYQGNTYAGGYDKGYQGNTYPGGYDKGYQGNTYPGGYDKGYQGNTYPGGYDKEYQGNTYPGGYDKAYQGNTYPGGYDKGYQGNTYPGGYDKAYQGNTYPGGYDKGYQGNNYPGGYDKAYQSNVNYQGGYDKGYQSDTNQGNSGYQGGYNGNGYQGYNKGPEGTNHYDQGKPTPSYPQNWQIDRGWHCDKCNGKGYMPQVSNGGYKRNDVGVYSRKDYKGDTGGYGVYRVKKDSQEEKEIKAKES